MPKNNIVNLLNQMAPQTGGHGLKVLVEFGDQPEVLEAIRDARLRRCSYRQIAIALSQDGRKLSAGAVQAYLASIGLQ